MWIVTDVNGILTAVNLGKMDCLSVQPDVDKENGWVIVAENADAEIVVKRCDIKTEAEGLLYGYAEALDNSARKARTE